MGSDRSPDPGEDGPYPGEDRTLWSPLQGGRGAGTSPTLSMSPEDNAEDPPEPFPNGTVLAQRFVTKKFLGRGGMGEVYEAEDLQLDHARVALKTIRADQIWRGNMRQRFRQEVLMARSIAHPNVCPVYELFSSWGPAGEISFLTMKLLNGETLAERLRRMSPMRAEDALRFGKEIAAALDCAHANGIIHRDLKPGNVFLEFHMTGVRAVVTDFGLARNWSEGHWSMDGGYVVGTPAYIAPELLNGDVATPQSDVYSFGIVLYEMFFGTRPDGAPREASRLDARYRALESASRRCLHANPELRYRSVGEAMRTVETTWARHSPLLTRRNVLAGTGAFLTGAAAVEFGWRGGWDLEEWLHPLPRPRRVAILPEADGRSRFEDASLVNGVLEQVGAELSRAEAAERDLFVVPPKILREKKVRAPSAALGMFGTNLALAASLVRGDSLALEMRVVASATGRIIRNARVTFALSSLYDLPRRAIERAAKLLDVAQRDLLGSRVAGGTTNAEAFAAFTRGREWMRQYGLPYVEKAIAELQKALDIDGQFAKAYAVLAEAYVMKFRLTKEPEALDVADRNCDKALALAPDLPVAYSRRAMIESARGNYDKAIRALRHAQQLEPEDSDSQVALAEAYWQSGRNAEADKVYAAMAKDRPNHWLALTNWGNHYLSKADYARAIELFKQATVIAPASALPWMDLGAAYIDTGKLPEASEALSKSAALLPSGGAYTNLGTILFWQGKFAEAAVAYAKATELAPGQMIFWGNLGDALIKLPGREADARQAWQKAADLAQRAVKTNGRDIDAWQGLALYQAKLGRGEEAIAILDRISRVHIADAEHFFAEAVVYELAGDRDRALDRLQKSIDSGYSPADVLHAPELESLRRDPRFKKLRVRDNEKKG
jgi:eukaryotic-like serine/threonine-protein kinase